MEARFLVHRLALLALVAVSSPAAAVANHARSQNFIVMAAPSPAFARQVAEEAERYRRDLAIKWLGRELPPWQRPCAVRVTAGNIPAQGVTTYQRHPGYVADFQMEVIGTPERILDSVLPHEITHTVLATHFGQPLPRWADEGISTTVEHNAERSKHEVKLREFLTTNRGIPMNRLFKMKEYPEEMLTLYAQGYSVCRFLIEQKGPREFIQFLETYLARGSWTDSIKRHYQYESLAELQDYWVAWVSSGSGDVASYKKVIDRGNQIALATYQQEQSEGLPPTDPVSLAQAVSSDGWYARQRDDPTGRKASTYSAAQPQPERGAVSRVPAGPSSTWTPSTQAARIWR